MYICHHSGIFAIYNFIIHVYWFLPNYTYKIAIIITSPAGAPMRFVSMDQDIIMKCFNDVPTSKRNSINDFCKMCIYPQMHNILAALCVVHTIEKCDGCLELQELNIVTHFFLAYIVCIHCTLHHVYLFL